MLGSREATDILKRLEQDASDPAILRHYVRESRRYMREHGFPSQKKPAALLEWLKGGALQMISDRLLEAIDLPEPVPIFFTYAREDLPLISAVKPMIERERVTAFVDSLELMGGELWEGELHRQIDRSMHVFVFWSRWSASSEWVEKEWRYAIDRLISEGLSHRFIVPVMLDDTRPEEGHPLARFQYLFFQAGQLEWEAPRI